MKKLLIRSTVLLAFAGLAIGAGGCTVESAPPASPVVRERVVAEPVPTRPVMVYYEGRWVRPWRGYRYREGEPLMVYREGRWYREARGYRRADWDWRHEPRRSAEPGRRNAPRRHAEPERRGDHERQAEPGHAEPGWRAEPRVRSDAARTERPARSSHAGTTGGRLVGLRGALQGAERGPGGRDRPPPRVVIGGTLPVAVQHGSARPPSKQHDSKHSGSPGHSAHSGAGGEHPPHEGGTSSQFGY